MTPSMPVHVVVPGAHVLDMASHHLDRVVVAHLADLIESVPGLAQRLPASLLDAVDAAQTAHDRACAAHRGAS